MPKLPKSCKCWLCNTYCCKALWWHIKQSHSELWKRASQNHTVYPKNKETNSGSRVELPDSKSVCLRSPIKSSVDKSQNKSDTSKIHCGVQDRRTCTKQIQCESAPLASSRNKKPTTLTTSLKEDVEMRQRQVSCEATQNSKRRKESSVNKKVTQKKTKDSQGTTPSNTGDDEGPFGSMPTRPSLDLLSYGTWSNNPTVGFKKLKNRMRVLKSEAKDVQRAATKMLDKLLPILNDKSKMSWKVMESGSYYDETQIIAPSEIDFMLIPTVVQCEAVGLDKAPPGFCNVKLMSDIPDLRDCCDSKCLLNVRKFKEKIFDIFEKVILHNEEFHEGRRMKRKTRETESPAFTVFYDYGLGSKLEIDFVPALRFEGWPKSAKKLKPKWISDPHIVEECTSEFHVVAKEGETSDLWRISFSKAENILLRYTGLNDTPSCRRMVFKCLKMCLQEANAKLEDRKKKLASFHLKTFMLHIYDIWPDDHFWNEETMGRDRLMECLHHLKRMLKLGEDGCVVTTPCVIINYFIEKDNILKSVPHHEIQNFRKMVQTFIKNY